MDKILHSHKGAAMMGRARWRRWAIRCCRLLLFLFTLAIGAGYRPPPGSGATAGCGRAPVDLVLLLDDSGSMGKETDEQNDPDNLRITAAHLMLDLLDPGDRAGLVLFSDQLREASALTEVGAVAGACHLPDLFLQVGGEPTRYAEVTPAGVLCGDAPAEVRALPWVLAEIPVS